MSEDITEPRSSDRVSQGKVVSFRFDGGTGGPGDILSEEAAALTQLATPGACSDAETQGSAFAEGSECDDMDVTVDQLLERVQLLAKMARDSMAGTPKSSLGAFASPAVRPRSISASSAMSLLSELTPGPSPGASTRDAASPRKSSTFSQLSYPSNAEDTIGRMVEAFQGFVRRSSISDTVSSRSPGALNSAEAVGEQAHIAAMTATATAVVLHEKALAHQRELEELKQRLSALELENRQLRDACADASRISAGARHVEAGTLCGALTSLQALVGELGKEAGIREAVQNITEDLQCIMHKHGSQEIRDDKLRKLFDGSDDSLLDIVRRLQALKELLVTAPKAEEPVSMSADVQQTVDTRSPARTELLAKELGEAAILKAWNEDLRSSAAQQREVVARLQASRRTRSRSPSNDACCQADLAPRESVPRLCASPPDVWLARAATSSASPRVLRSSSRLVSPRPASPLVCGRQFSQGCQGSPRSLRMDASSLQSEVALAQMAGPAQRRFPVYAFPSLARQSVRL